MRGSSAHRDPLLGLWSLSWLVVLLCLAAAASATDGNADGDAEAAAPRPAGPALRPGPDGEAPSPRAIWLGFADENPTSHRLRSFPPAPEDDDCQAHPHVPPPGEPYGSYGVGTVPAAQIDGGISYLLYEYDPKDLLPLANGLEAEIVGTATIDHTMTGAIEDRQWLRERSETDCSEIGYFESRLAVSPRPGKLTKAVYGKWLGEPGFGVPHFYFPEEERPPGGLLSRFTLETSGHGTVAERFSPVFERIRAEPALLERQLRDYFFSPNPSRLSLRFLRQRDRLEEWPFVRFDVETEPTTGRVTGAYLEGGGYDDEPLDDRGQPMTVMYWPLFGNPGKCLVTDPDCPPPLHMWPWASALVDASWSTRLHRIATCNRDRTAAGNAAGTGEANRGSIPDGLACPRNISLCWEGRPTCPSAPFAAYACPDETQCHVLRWPPSKFLTDAETLRRILRLDLRVLFPDRSDVRFGDGQGGISETFSLSHENGGITVDRSDLDDGLYLPLCLRHPTSRSLPSQVVIEAMETDEGFETDLVGLGLEATVFAIDGIGWVGVDPGDGATNLTADNPDRNGGGYRIFPGRNKPGKLAKTHHAVEAEVRVVPAVPVLSTLDIFAKVFDVDDPTDSGTEVDPEDRYGQFIGNDNLGLKPTIEPAEIQVRTLSEGESSVRVRYELKAFHPGNNFKVAAACDRATVEDLELNPTVQNGLTEVNSFRLASQPEVKPPDQSSGSLLSVWRRLWVRKRRMGPIAGNFREGDGDTGLAMIQPNNSGRTTVRVGVVDLEYSYGNGRFENGRLYLESDGPYAIHSNINSAFIVDGPVAPHSEEAPWRAYDDDAEQFLEYPRLEIPWPEPTYLESAFEPAFMVVTPEGPAEERSFAANVPGGQILATHGSREPGSPVPDPEYWWGVTMGAFQGPVGRDPLYTYNYGDSDPDQEAATVIFGIQSDNGCLIFAEVIRDVIASTWDLEDEAAPALLRKTLAHVHVHEIGHMCGLVHEDGNEDSVMTVGTKDDQERPEDWLRKTVFSPRSLRKLRGETLKSPVASAAEEE